MSVLDRMRGLPIFINGKKFMPENNLTALESASVLHQYIRCSFNLCATRCAENDDCIRRLGLERHFVMASSKA